jgi:hypothetical protein
MVEASNGSIVVGTVWMASVAQNRKMWGVAFREGVRSSAKDTWRRNVSARPPWGAEARKAALERNVANANSTLQTCSPSFASSGASLHQIADALNARGIASPRGGRWYAKSVSNALARSA